MRLHKLFDITKHDFFMLDLESAGLSPTNHFITSLALVKFSPETGDVLDKLHFRFIDRPPLRWTTQTNIDWRKEHNVDEMESELQGLFVLQGLTEIDKFLDIDNSERKNPVIFANHTEFDIGFLQSYYDEYSEKRPWIYNHVYDLGSILLGRGIVDKYSFYAEVLLSERWEKIKALHFEGQALQHNAFYDCVLQIEVLMEAFRRNY